MTQLTLKYAGFSKICQLVLSSRMVVSYNVNQMQKTVV